jgi:type 1 fimbria pilin
MKIPTVALRAIVALWAIAVFAAATSAAAGPKTFSGIISDDMCARGDHSRMRMVPTDAECVLACVSGHGAAYVLYDGKDVYTLSGRQALEKFAAHKVKITGELDEKTQTIRMDSITSAK